MDDKDDDRVLVDKIIEATNSKAKITAIEKIVKRDAVINTNRRLDKMMFELVDIELDVNKSQVRSLSDVDDVVYWILSVKTKNPSVVGVAWVKGEMKIFYGVVLPP